jgi:AraC-like DNA-binding protein
MPYVSHLFKNILGISFQEYLKEKRFEHALELLNTTSKTILDIAIESGFSDLRYMTKAFREKYGCTPKEYRRQHPSLLQSTRSSAENRQELLHPEESLPIVRELLGTVPDLEE